MTAAAATAERPRAMTSAERQRRYRESHRKAGRGHRVIDDIGPAIAEGEPFEDDFEKCEAKWSALLAGARFTDREPLR